MHFVNVAVLALYKIIQIKFSAITISFNYDLLHNKLPILFVLLQVKHSYRTGQEGYKKRLDNCKELLTKPFPDECGKTTDKVCLVLLVKKEGVEKSMLPLERCMHFKNFFNCTGGAVAQSVERAPYQLGRCQFNVTG